jgi:hypothetical protein
VVGTPSTKSDVSRTTTTADPENPLPMIPCHRAFGVLLPPAAYWSTASLACRGGSDCTASPESTDVTFES